METIKSFINMFLHLDKVLEQIIHTYGTTTYLLIFAVIFCETGLVFIPFLPGDSLVFAAGSFAANPAYGLNIWVLYIILCFAAVLGDTANYHIGKLIGSSIMDKEKVLFIKKEYLERTHKFYEKHGGKTIILARFIPIIRTFAPFVAGAGEMTYLHFISFNLIGGVSWITIMLFLGYFFGGLTIVKNNFEMVIFGIVFISILPGIIQYVRHKITSKKTLSDASIEAAYDKEKINK